MTAGINTKLPYGNIPRLLLAWVCTEAVRTRSRVLILGKSLSEFMRALGIYSSGGGNAGIKLRNQMRRLFGCTVQLTYQDEYGEQFFNSPIAARGKYWPRTRVRVTSRHLAVRISRGPRIARPQLA